MRVSSFIVGHRRCAFRPWPRFRHLVYPGHLAPVDGLDDLVLEDREDLEPLHNNRTSEYFYLFGLRRQIQRRPAEFGDAIMVAHYRRFLADRRLGPLSRNIPWVCVVTPQQAEALDPAALMPQHSRETGWYIAQPMSFKGGLIAQTAWHHPVEDFLRFLASAVDTGVLEPARIPLLLSPDTRFVPAPSASVVPVEFFVSAMLRLETCARHFLAHGWREYEGPQRRIIGFCLERLHSCLVLDEVERLGLDVAQISGIQTVVNDRGDIIEPSV